jgi:hypothetical protein
MITNKTIAAAAVLVSVLSGVAAAQTAAPSPAATAAPAATATAPATKEIDPATAKFRAACKAEIDTLCGAEIAAAKAAAASAPAGTEPAKGQGGGRVMGACMTANEAKLSADCKTAWTERKAAWAAKKG